MTLEEIGAYTGYQPKTLPSMRLRSGKAKKMGLEKKNLGKHAPIALH